MKWQIGHDVTGLAECPWRSLILHGGEPWTRIQTNAVELYLRLFRELGVGVGVSLDGAADGHNRHRRFASGCGSYAAVSAALDRLRQDRYRDLFTGFLCTVDLRNEPVAT
jgi:uncharacterized protein